MLGDQLPRGITALEALWFLSFSSVAWQLWTHNEELVGMKGAQVRLGESFHKITLTFRKTNQSDPDKSNCYEIYPTPDEPATNTFMHLKAWYDYMASVYAINDADYVFPKIRGNQLQHGTPMSTDDVLNLLTRIAEATGILEDRAGKYTTHCFRRGGCQHRFMIANYKWSLTVVRWWGGWAANESVDTVIKYLLEELDK